LRKQAGTQSSFCARLRFTVHCGGAWGVIVGQKKIAAFGSSYRVLRTLVGAAEGCDLFACD